MYEIHYDCTLTILHASGRLRRNAEKSNGRVRVIKNKSEHLNQETMFLTGSKDRLPQCP